MKKGLFPIVGDILHAGHVIAMEEAKEHCDYLIVALNIAPEGKKTVQSAYERYMQLRAVKFIDEIIVYSGSSDADLIASSLDYQIRFVGDDYRNKSWDGEAIEKALNKETYFLRRNHDMSSTSLKKRVKENKA